MLLHLYARSTVLCAVENLLEFLKQVERTQQRGDNAFLLSVRTLALSFFSLRLIWLVGWERVKTLWSDYSLFA